MSDDSGIYAADGTYLGEHYEAEDGAHLLVDESTGEVLAAVNEAGETIDHSGYYIDTGDDVGDRLSALEQQAAQPPPPPFDYGAAQEEARQEAAANRFTREAQVLEQELGRSLSDREMHGILSNYKADLEAGVEPNIYNALNGVNIPVGGSHEQRVARAMDSLEDAQRRENGEEYEPDAKPWHEPASSSESDVRVARALNFLDHNVSSSEQAAQDEILNEYEQED